MRRPKAADADLPELSRLLYTVAREIAQQVGADPVLTAMAMGHAAMKMLREASPTAGDALSAAQIFAQSSIQSMADIVSGQDAKHQVRQ